jgi:hypothetical protein
VADFYYQIKGLRPENNSWSWPPVHVGAVYDVKDKKAAKAAVEEELGRQFPSRVIRAKMGEEPYLLTIRSMSEHDKRTREIFEDKECLRCNGHFRVVDHYNDDMALYKGREYCSSDCKEADYNERKLRESVMYEGQSIIKSRGVIYSILHVPSGKRYVGQTTIAFTLRWHQHLNAHSGNKFHSFLSKNDKIEEWQFSILERVELPQGEEPRAYMNAREQYWITHYNTIEDGLNTAVACKKTEAKSLDKNLALDLE